MELKNLDILELFDYFRGDAACYTIGWNIFCDHAVGADNDIVTDFYPRIDVGIGADQYIVADDDILNDVFFGMINNELFRVYSDRINSGIVGNGHVVSDNNFGAFAHRDMGKKAYVRVTACLNLSIAVKFDEIAIEPKIFG